MDLESGEEEEDFEKNQRNEVRVEIPQDTLIVVERFVLREQEGGEIEPVEALSVTFLQNIVSDRMDMDLGEEYEERVQEIVNELEESGREAGLDESPSRTMKKELIERMETSRESRKVGDGKVSSESAEEIERIVIEDSVEGENYLSRTVGQEEDDEPVPHRNVLTPVLESTPMEGHEKERGKLSFRPLTAPPKKWVAAESTDEVPDKYETDQYDKSSSGESSADRKSPLSVVSSGRRVPENEVPPISGHLEVMATGPPGFKSALMKEPD